MKLTTVVHLIPCDWQKRHYNLDISIHIPKKEKKDCNFCNIKS